MHRTTPAVCSIIAARVTSSALFALLLTSQT